MPVLAVLIAYLLGSVPFAFLLARRLGTPDLHLIGSGNIGAANVSRASGMRAGIVVAVLDIAKGAASVWLANGLNVSGPTSAAAGLAAIVGHIYPVWLRFRGGKGVATACGVFGVLTPFALVPSIVVFLAAAWMTKYVSVGSVLATATLPWVALITGSAEATVVAAASAALLIVFRHRSNLVRVWQGTERRVGVRA